MWGKRVWSVECGEESVECGGGEWSVGEESVECGVCVRELNEEST